MNKIFLLNVPTEWVALIIIKKIAPPEKNVRSRHWSHHLCICGCNEQTVSVSSSLSMWLLCVAACLNMPQSVVTQCLIYFMKKIRVSLVRCIDVAQCHRNPIYQCLYANHSALIIFNLLKYNKVQVLD